MANLGRKRTAADRLKETGRKVASERFTRAEVTDEQIKAKIFSLFEMHEYWGLDDMHKQLKLPRTAVKQQLVTIAELSLEKETRNKYRLKSELRPEL